jgi:hypothetical protein
LNSTNKTFTYFAKVALEVLGAKNNPTFVWQRAQLWLMELITKANMSYPNLDIHRSDDVITVAH